MSTIVVKRDGSRVKFDKDILINSLKNSGASRKIAKEIANKIESSIKDGDTTTAIYSKAFNALADYEEGPAMRYSLRRALFSLGPTGFPFEKFISQVFERKGYKCATNLHMQGKCANHEIDVLAKGNDNIILEVKFHNSGITRTDLKTVMYVHSRFNDLIGSDNVILDPNQNDKLDKGILVTNTKFTSNAISYAECSNVELLGWGYPVKNSLKKMIEETNTHPITCLPSLNKSTSRKFFEKNIITCKNLLENQDTISEYGVNQTLIDKLVRESAVLCTQNI